jgi:ribosomal protein S18 acetylase RimI-like enzyme
MNVTFQFIELDLPHEGKLSQLLAFDERGLVVGTISADCKGNSVEFNRLYVAPDCRRKGIGKELVRRIIQAAQNNECKSVRCAVHPKNTEAVAFYESLGFFNAGEVYDDLLFVIQT